VAEDFDVREAPPGLPDFLSDPVGLLSRRWPWMLGALVIGLGCSAAFVALLQPRYVASATLLISNQQIPEEFVRTTVQEDSQGRINTMMGAVLSRATLGALMEKYDLYAEEQGILPRVELLDRMRTSIAIAEEKSPGGSRRDETARLFEIAYEADEPEVAAQVANELAGRLIAESIRIRTQQARLTTQFLRRELEETERELREQSGKITKFKQRHRGELPGELHTNLSTLDRLQQQRQSLALQIAEAETRMLTLTSPSSGLPAEDATPLERLLALRAALAQARAMKTAAHPDVVALKMQIAKLEQEVPQIPGDTPGEPPSRQSLLSGSQRTLVELRAQLSTTEARIKALDARVASTPLRQEEIGALEERETVLRENYLAFLRKVQGAELAESLESAQQGGRVSIVDEALAPSKPTRSRFTLLAAGIIASLAFSLGTGVLLEIRDPVLVTTQQLEAAAGLPVLGSVPRIS